ncbi:related to TPR domain protein [Cephalotrichum gorgonifer]|uniref:Related to TPR domain protein n=1 Tax=Cephalotrichum gorgonifer TaxID=2041049 RepID=A0AAE8N1Z6_9PEZI|nr:related to TPR domain protein [Cephalotrichum gorgonifer]
MDTKDVSDVGYFAAMLQTYQNAADQASKRKGQQVGHHRGSMALPRTLTPPQRMTAVMAIVEDEQGTAVLLQLYHQPEDSAVPTQEILQKGAICIVKEPFFKCSTDGTYSLRVDHVSDIIWLDGWDDRVPSKWRVPFLAPSDGSKGIRGQGNKAVKNQEWAKAERLYSHSVLCAGTWEEEQIAYLNHSLVNLKLGRPEKAMKDAAWARVDVLPPEKCLFYAKRDLERAKERLHEQKTGDYDFRRMYKQAEPMPPLVDCANFSTPVEVRKSPGRGKGLFTTVPISVGELLLCEKAFAYSYAGEDDPVRSFSVLMNMSTKKVTVGGQAHLIMQIVQKLYHGPVQSCEFRELYCGDYNTPRVFEEYDPVVDLFWVEKIISLNVFGAPCTSRATIINSVSDMNEKT